MCFPGKYEQEAEHILYKRWPFLKDCYEKHSAVFSE
jgi:hypothetical protein